MEAAGTAGTAVGAEWLKTALMPPRQTHCPACCPAYSAARASRHQMAANIRHPAHQLLPGAGDLRLFSLPQSSRASSCCPFPAARTPCRQTWSAGYDCRCLRRVWVCRSSSVNEQGKRELLVGRQCHRPWRQGWCAGPPRLLIVEARPRGLLRQSLGCAAPACSTHDEHADRGGS